METCFVARDNSAVLTVKLGRETSLVAYSTDKRSMPEWRTFQDAKGHVTFESFLHESSFCHEAQLDASVIYH